MGTKLAMVCAMVALPTGLVRADVGLEWRPFRQGASVNDIVDIRVFAVSDTGFDQDFGGIDLVFTWDPAHLELLGHINPCTQEPCPPDTYLWLQSWFPDDSQLDGLNDDLDDGDALFQVFAQLGGGDVLPLASPQGLWVTTLQFRVLATGISEVVIEEEIGSTRSRVAGGIFPGIEVTGELGPPSEVVSVQCLAPVVMAAGSRYLSVTPQLTSTPVALVVTGSENDPAVECILRYVQSDGSLGPMPHFRMPIDWGTVQVTGEAIQPSTGYNVQADCVASSPGFFLSPPTPAITWSWGDTDNNGNVGITDLSNVADAASGTLPPGIELSQVDIAPCVPDGLVDQKDVDAVLAAIARNPFPCVEPCTIVTMEDLPMFASCMDGPSLPAMSVCLDLDFNGDYSIDLLDAAAFQRMFAMNDAPTANESAPVSRR